MGVMPIKLLINLNHKYDFWKIKEHHIKKISEALPNVEVEVYNSKSDDIYEQLPQTDIYFGWAFPVKWLEAAKNLKWIATPSAGADYIAAPEIEASGVLFTTSSGYHGYPMAQHALGFILAFSRGIIYSSRVQTVKQNYRSDAARESFDIRGCSMAIIGCGSIGTILAQMAGCFDVNVYGIRRTLPGKMLQDNIKWITPDSLHDILPACKIAVNLLPSSQTTANYFDRELFGKMKPGTVFINLGRGSTVDEDALLWALDEGIISWCGLDVLAQEPAPIDHPLKSHPRVVVTPHSAAFTDQFMDAAVDFFIDQCKNYMAGGNIKNIVYPAAQDRIKT